MKKSRPRRDWPLRWKFALVYVACVVLPLGIAFSFFYANAVERLKNSHLQATRALLEQVRKELSLQVEMARSVADGLWGDLRITEALDAEPVNTSQQWDDRRMIDAALLGYRNAHWELSEIRIYHDNPYLFRGGRVLYVAPAADGSTPWPKGLEQTRPVLELRTGTLKNKPAAFLVRALHSTTDQYRKVLRLDLDMDRLDLALRNRSVGQTQARLQLVGPDGITYAASPEWRQVPPDAGEEVLDRYEDRFPEQSLLSGWTLQTVVLGSDLIDEMRLLRNRFLQMLLICAFIATSVMVLFARSITKRLVLLSKTMKGSESQRLLFVPQQHGNDEIAQTIRQYNRMAERTNRLIDEVYRLGMQKNAIALEQAKAELQFLQAQVNPHFLNNVLNTIQSKCLLRDEVETASVIQSLARLFRRMVAAGADRITVREELAVVREYLLIQSYRFEDRLIWDLDVPPDVQDLMLPKMVVQILVENASVHGIERKRNKGHIRVKLRATDTCLLIRVSDNGAGIPEETLAQLQGMIKRTVPGEPLVEEDSSGAFDLREVGLKESHGQDSDQRTDVGQEHLGLDNIRRRLALYYGQAARLRIRSREGIGTTVEMRIPRETGMRGKT
jgi:two-component system sensor histidine kinase YesM